MRNVFLLVVLLLAPRAAIDAAEETLRDEPATRRDAMLRAQLAKPYPGSGCWHYEDFALAAYWLNERTAEADQALLTEREKDFPAVLKDGRFHWHAYLLERTARSQHPSVMCAATTFWRPSVVVAELARDAADRGVYEYVSRRPGLAAPTGEKPRNFVADPAHPFREARGVYGLRPEGGGLLRYSYCTPDFVLGTSMVEARPKEDWTNISSQNRWEGVIFGGHRTARIFVQPLQPKRGSVYNANWSAQKRGVLVVQRLKGSNAKGQRVWFDASLPRVEANGWVFAKAPRAYAAVRVVTGGTAWEPDAVEQHHEGKGRTDLGVWLRCLDEFSPVILEVGAGPSSRTSPRFSGRRWRTRCGGRTVAWTTPAGFTRRR